jgi:hypothetical protein
MQKLTYLAISLFLALSVTAYAQTGEKGSDMMTGQGSQHQMTDNTMMDHGKEMMQHPQGGMGDMNRMEEKEMHQKMSPCMGKMQDMMQNMNKMMEKDMKSEDRAKMADIMKDMSKHMMDMSVMMKNGQCTIEQMEKLDKGVSDTEQGFRELEDYL